MLTLTANSLTESLDNRVSVLKRAGIKELDLIIVKSYRVFDNFPNNYNGFLDEMKLKRRELNSKLGAGLARDFGEYTRSIYKFFPDEAFNFVREAFERYIDDHLKDYMSSNFKKSDLFQRKYITGFQASKAIGAKIEFVRECINKGIVTGCYEPKNRLYNTVLVKKEFELFKDNLIKGIPLLASIIWLKYKHTS
ncbi:hypothetical protein [Paenibacillus chitinolyticus]|uniref:hypothetical protein n=1 Tax=Paenibacillus chitinolyticus TaxID=79263 RepID=UPI003D064F13